MTALQRLYDDQMDTGTARFAVYYKEWLKCGDTTPPPPFPSVPLPSMTPGPGGFDMWEERRSASARTTSSINRNLYNAVFGTALEQEDVKLFDEAELVLDKDVQLDENSGSLKMEKHAHTEKHWAPRKAFQHSKRKHYSRNSIYTTQILLFQITLMSRRCRQECH